MEMQPKVFVHNCSFTIKPTDNKAKEFLEHIEKFNIDLDPENDEDFKLFEQEIFSPSVELVSSSSIMLQFITKDEPFDLQSFILYPIYYECLASMIYDYESREDAGVYMWFGDKVIHNKINKAYFILKKIDALRITDAPNSYEEVALMVEEPIKVIKFVLEQIGVSLEQLPYTNFRPNIRDNEFFKKK